MTKRISQINWELLVLIILGSTLSAVFVYDGFATGDSLRYALGIHTISAEGLSQLKGNMNWEMSVGYYFLVMKLYALFGEMVSLSGLMNHISAMAAIGVIATLFIFFNSLGVDKRLSFFACLLIILTPSFWMHSYYGHPIMLGLLFFVISLIVYERIVASEDSKPLRWFILLLLIIATLTIRLDLVLAFGAYWGILQYHRSLFSFDSIKIVLLSFLAVITILLMYSLVFGHILIPGFDTTVLHLGERLHLGNLIKIILKNGAMWALSVTIPVLFLAIIGLFRLGLRSSYSVLMLLWVLPFFIFLPFKGVNISRICMPTVPIIVLVAIMCADSFIKRSKTLALCLVLVTIQVATAALYYPLIKVYPFKIAYHGRMLAYDPNPIGFPPLDHYYRQGFVKAGDKIAKRVTSEKDADVLIVCGPYYVRYLYNLIQNRGGKSLGGKVVCGVKLKEIVTKENVFYILLLEHNMHVKNPIKKAVECLGLEKIKIHMPPSSLEYPSKATVDRPFLTKAALAEMLKREQDVMKTKRKITTF